MRNFFVTTSLAAFVIFLMTISSCKESTTENNEQIGKQILLNLESYNLSTEAFRTASHQEYLNDPLAFKNLPDGGVRAAKTFVVGSKVCLFYPNATLKSIQDLESLPKGIPVPFGTILPQLGEKVVSSDSDRIGMFSFQDQWNWFYPSEFQGKKGLVFGADLYGISETAEKNKITSLLYTTEGRYSEFYPVSGYNTLSASVQAQLKQEKLAFQTVAPTEYDLYAERPDDMISLYLNNKPSYYNNPKIPVFITTDLASHAQHLVFDRLLQHLEESYFMPRLKELVDNYINALRKQLTSADEYKETLEKAILYYQTAQALLELSPTLVEKEDKSGRKTKVYEDVDTEAILQKYPTEVRAEVSLMDKAEGFAKSSIFTFQDGSTIKEDYSQYKPRGHYTKNGILKAYFRAMMWFGRIHFLIAKAGVEPLAEVDDKSSNSSDLTEVMAPIALLVTELVKNNSDLYEDWSRLFDPITALIGLSDDLSFKEVLPLWKDQNVSDFGKWVSKKENLTTFIKLAHEKLRPPALSGSSVFWGPSEGSDRSPPMGWRFFGQRFTYDSSVHFKVSPPRLMTRDMVRGLDIMKAFGSQTADLLLQKSDYPAMEGLKTKLDEIELVFSKYSGEFWKQSYYNQVLYQVKTQSQFEPGAGFYFTETPAWGIKAMLSSHGTWAELRHDTILYVKQVYGERAGDGDFEPTFRTLPVPDPVHYIEPNVPFWEGCASAVEILHQTLRQFGLMDEESSNALAQLHEIFVRCVKISKLEAANSNVDTQDVQWIPTIPAELVHIVLIHSGNGFGSIEPEKLRMAVVADVYTNAGRESVLEVGVGIPYRIYVPLNDAQGGKRIAVGYTFSYYEFEHPMNDRLTDEKWKAEVYDENKDLSDKAPFWAQNIAVPPDSKP